MDAFIGSCENQFYWVIEGYKEFTVEENEEGNEVDPCLITGANIVYLTL